MAPAEQAAGRTVKWLVSGRVQGVGFRYFVTHNARRIGLDGDVRNLRDGRVEIRVRGARNDLDLLLVEVRRGPSGSRVDDVDEQQVDGPAFDGFEVRF